MYGSPAGRYSAMKSSQARDEHRISNIEQRGPMRELWRKVTSHEPSRLRVADPRSGPRLCEAQRFMVPMRDRKVVEAFHEPGGARLRRALISLL